MRSALPETLMDMAERSAAPATVLLALRRALEERPDLADRLVDGDAPSGLGRAFVAVVAASNALGRLGAADPRAFDVLDDLDHPVVIDATDALALARSKRLELLRIAARDLLAIDTLDEVGRGLADMADRVLQGAWSLAAGEIGGADLAVIGMGKLGGRELNYASDVDVMFVTDGRGIEGAGDKLARRLLAIARGCFRVDVDLRPEGRSGPLTRSLDGYRSYWNKGALAWEFQALMKARPVAGDVDIGAGFAGAAEQATWSRTFSADELAQLRMMKARAEADALRPGLAGREIKRAPGGIRDVEFSVQLLQLVHGHHDPDIRDRSTLGALTELALAGYVSPEDGRVLADSYRFLRTVEHRLQLVEEEQTHALPTDAAARDRLARVLGFTDGPASTATASFDETLRRCQSEVRIIHERLFFRPLLEAFAVLEPSPPVEGTGDAPVRVMSADAVSRRLTAFGFSDARRTRAAVEELARGLSRVSRLMGQLLPLLLDWLSISPDPDLGLLGLRSLVVRSHHRALVVTTFRESLEAARRLCLILGSSRAMAEAVEHNPELIATLDDDRALAPESRAELVEGALERLHRPGDEGRRRARLVRFTQDHTLRIATRDLLGIDDVASTGAALTVVSEAVLEAALEHAAPEGPFCVVGMGRLGGAEMSYASDLDVLLVFEDAFPAGHDRAVAMAEETAEAFLRFLHGPSPAQRIASLDLGLRPEGGQGRLARDLAGYETYFDRWAQTWERQALLRARVVAGDVALGERFLALARQFIWDRPLSDADIADIRRMKARIERERIPPREDPQFHLKLGRGSLSDIEWTAQLLQLRHGVEATGTIAALDALTGHGALAVADAETLGHAYRFLEHTRNRWHLVGALPGGTSPGDSLPTEAHQQSSLARSLGTSPAALRDEYRRVTRRARRVVERLFYGIDET